MASHSMERSSPDAARGRSVSITPLTVTPLLVTYILTSLVVDRAFNVTKGPLIVVLAVLLVGSVILEWRGVRLTQAWRVATCVGSGGLGILLAVLVSG